MTQFGLFDAPLSLLESERGTVTYHAGFLPIANAESCFAVLREGIDWHAQRRVMYEREVDVPRLTAHFRIEDLVPDNAADGATPEAAAALRDIAARVGAALSVPF